jgi:polysaccharide transporter, PST family
MANKFISRKFISRILKNSVTQNALSLFVFQIARYILPIVTVPYLARVLGPEALGLVVFSQASAQWFEMLLDYGFNLSATREIARYRDKKQQVIEIVAGVVAASAFLLIVSVLVVIAMGLSIPVFREHPDYLVWTWVIGIFQGLSPLWYFQGMEKMKLPAMLDFGVRIIATILTFLWIAKIDEGWKVLAIQAMSAFLVYGLMLIAMYQDISWKFPNFNLALSTLRMSWNMFLFRGSVSLFTTANVFIIGLFLPTKEVAFFGEAQRLTRTIGSLANPVTQAVFPRISYLIAVDFKKAAKLVLINIFLMGVSSCFISLLLILMAPFIVNILLGDKFESAIPLLQILVILLPFMSLNYVLGIQWMIPLNLDHIFNKIVMIAGLLNLIVSPVLTQRFGSKAMAVSVVLTEAFVTLSMYIFLLRKDLSPYKVWKFRNTELI